MITKLMRISFVVLELAFITGCNNTNNNSNNNSAVIKRDDCAPLDVITCYTDSNNKQECVGSELCLYVEYNNNRMDINEALKQKLVTLDDVKKAYNQFYESLKN